MSKTQQNPFFFGGESLNRSRTGLQSLWESPLWLQLWLRAVVAHCQPTTFRTHPGSFDCDPKKSKTHPLEKSSKEKLLYKVISK